MNRTVHPPFLSAVCDFVALGACGDNTDRHADFRLDEIHIGAGGGRELSLLRHAADVTFPAGQRFVNGLGPVQAGGGGEAVCHLTVNFITGADFDFIQVAENIQTSQSHLCSTLHHAAVFGGHRIKPANPAGTACGCAELAFVTAAAAQLIASIAGQLTDKWLSVRAYVGGIGF